MAIVPALTLPYTFVNGTIIDAGQVNADFAAVMNGVNTNSRTLLTAATTFYVAPGGQDVPGNGLSITAPAATIGFIINLLQNNYDLNMQVVTIQLANGTYNESTFFSGDVAGLSNALHLIIQGNMASPNLVVWNGNPCLHLLYEATCTVQGVTMQSSISQCIISELGAQLGFSNIIFTAVPGAHLVAARQGMIQSLGNYSITGGGQYHAVAYESANVFLDTLPGNYMGQSTPPGAPTITLTGPPAFSVGFIGSIVGSAVRVGATFSGTATGPRYIATMNGVVDVIGQGLTYLPGNAVGVLANGGQYS
jgi:hypothetical protein